MANKENIDLAIRVMERVRDNKYKFDIRHYIINLGRVSLPANEIEAAECGTIACFAGWLALSPENKVFGLEADSFLPTNDILARVLDISTQDAETLTGTSLFTTAIGINCDEEGDEIDYTEPEHVLDALHYLREHGKFKRYD